MLGIDIEVNSRFENKDRVKDSKFLEKIFTPSELDYCFSKSNPSGSLCARFCVKEAVIKVLSYKGIKHSKLNDIEVYHGELGEPYVRLLDDTLKNIEIDISISHDKTKSIAIAQIKN